MHSLLSWDYRDVGERLGSTEKLSIFSSWRLYLKPYVYIAVFGFTPFVWFILVYSHDEKMK